ncbi:hypothetical protein MTR_4g119615 [Medicago truncatula]|uniref:Uncharacterized protein n=1 Tax=Medicago truncatula TaxID=3880 RepID=A0A072UR31_MEDTR|nr:hypothetical protein MTR_4g119615 [Medicago truncatula]
MNKPRTLYKIIDHFDETGIPNFCYPEKRLSPRASVIQYLLSKGLMKKDASLTAPFYLKDELFLQRYVKRFGDEASVEEDASIWCLHKLSKHILV